VSLSDQGHTDEHGEAPVLLLDWLPHVAAVVYEVRAENQAEALKKAQAEAARRTS
jgi:predicted GNAT superfamily acetyltransferase